MNPLKGKRQATLTATTMAVYLSLNVEVMDDHRGTDCIAVPLLSLSWVLMIGWLARLCWGDVQRHLDYRRHQWHLFWRIAGIGWRSVAWSIGL